MRGAHHSRDLFRLFDCAFVPRSAIVPSILGVRCGCSFPTTLSHTQQCLGGPAHRAPWNVTIGEVVRGQCGDILVRLGEGNLVALERCGGVVGYSALERVLCLLVSVSRR